jgi:hypothetical protein
MLKRQPPLAAGLLCLRFLLGFSLGFLLPAELVLSLPAQAQSLDEMLASGKLPDDARFAPGELTLGPVLSGALEEASAETLLDNREHGFCIARTSTDKSADIEVFALSRGNQMGIRLKCGHDDSTASGEMHTHPSFSAGIPSTEDFGSVDPAQSGFLVAHPQDGEATAVLLTRKARDLKSVTDPNTTASSTAVIRVMVLEFMQGARPAQNGKQHDDDFADLYLSAVCEKLNLSCYHRAATPGRFARVGQINDVISAKFNPDEQRRGLIGVQFLLDWLGGKDFHLTDRSLQPGVTSMSAALDQLAAMGSAKWLGAVIFTSPHIITNVRFPTDAGHDFIGLAIPPSGDQKIIETGGKGLRTFSATEDAFDPDAPISRCIRLGEDVTIDGGRFNDALFGDISAGQFQHHCFSLRPGSALQLTASEVVSDGFMTTTLVTDGRTSISKTPLADFCPPSRQTIVFCSRKPSFSVP